jgi:hypothetical protein
MAVQTSYSVYHAAKYAGQVNQLNPFDSVSRHNGTGATIPFGYAVVTSGTDGAALPVDTDTELTFIGVSMRELNRAFEDSETFGAKDAQDFTVVTSGRVAVVAGATVAKDDPVYMIVGDGTTPNTLLGKFTNVVGATTTTAVLIPNAKFEEAGTLDAATWVKFK